MIDEICEPFVSKKPIQYFNILNANVSCYPEIDSFFKQHTDWVCNKAILIEDQLPIFYIFQVNFYVYHETVDIDSLRAKPWSPLMINGIPCIYCPEVLGFDYPKTKNKSAFILTPNTINIIYRGNLKLANLFIKNIILKLFKSKKIDIIIDEKECDSQGHILREDFLYNDKKCGGFDFYTDTRKSEVFYSFQLESSEEEINIIHKLLQGEENYEKSKGKSNGIIGLPLTARDFVMAFEEERINFILNMKKGET